MAEKAKKSKVFDMKKREDRMGEYMKPKLSRFVFGEFSDDFLSKNNLLAELKSVPIPIKSEDLKNFAGGEGMTPDVIADNMVWVMGCDPHFKYNDRYIMYLRKTFNKNLNAVLLDMAKKHLSAKEFDEAFIYARAALVLDSYDRDAMYTYAVVTRDMYTESEEQEYVGRAKAESIEYFERLTIEFPGFAPSYYYLGYAYLNLGLYKKAEIVWEKFVMLSDMPSEQKEIEDRLAEIKEPVEIEWGCNEILATRYLSGINALEKFLGGKFDRWWPLHFYLGIAYENTANTVRAEAEFRKVLSINPSHIETMKELVDIYTANGDEQRAEKYKKKIELVDDKNDVDS